MTVASLGEANVRDGATVYVADAGDVVQADVADGKEASPPRSCEHQNRRDKSGVPLGPTGCFAYAGAAAAAMEILIGGHMPYLADPRTAALSFYGLVKPLRYSGDLGRAPVTLLRDGKAERVYLVRYRGARYRAVIQSTFPGLLGAIWFLARIDRS
jgi:hypothetical protein